MSTTETVTDPVVVGSAADLLPGESRTYAVEGTQVAVFRMTDGSVRATGAVCPHRGGPLADGQFDAVKVVCPLHQYAFAFDDGECTTGGIGVAEVHRAEVRGEDIVVWV